ncbi:DUF1540 domain-containing protein [Solwaraspora sp. WMMB335]|uniref:DUF1540 domain-containing protein n=1 Tax=Solwaraspora sp. WMMB335 TaxID=3404118 RepID=UPI003B92C28F
MTTLLEMPRVHECTVTGCDYNHEGCHAFAITIGQQSANCATFIDIGVKGGLDRVTAQVGACKRTDCRHNAELECTAPAIRVGPGRDEADCLTYEAR